MSFHRPFKKLAFKFGTPGGISYLNGVGRLYETGSRRSRQEAESLQYVDGKAIPRASQSNIDLNRTIAISERNNQTLEDYRNARYQTNAPQNQRRTIEKESFWGKALKVVVGAVAVYAAYELIDAIAESPSAVSNRVASRARPRSNMLLPSQARDSDVQASPMIRFGWGRDSGVRYMNQPTHQTYMTSLQSNFNQNDGYLSGSNLGSTYSYNSQGEVFRISRVVLGAGCPFKLKLPNLYSEERFALNQINQRPSGLTGPLDISENYFGKNYCVYTLAGRSPLILPKGKTAPCSRNISL